MRTKGKIAAYQGLRLAVFSGVIALSGCLAPAAVPVIGAEAAALESGKDKEQFREAFREGRFRYKTEMSESGCPKREYALSEGILDYAESRPSDGLEKVIEELTEIERDESNSDEVRAEAIYHKGVALMYQGELAKEMVDEERQALYGKARSNFEKLRDEFPQFHECAVDYHLNKLDKLANKEVQPQN
ncbi:hypothetical protein [Allohahella sp. A8]|jgi:hypothetical protein|uniref:hypothetical protein n=1 Tax=Allohahella sp. A8 TaxID=3141461 RepID=UPI003A8038CD